MRKCLILAAMLATLTSGANAQGMGNWVGRHNMELGQSARVYGAPGYGYGGGWGGGYGQGYYPRGGGYGHYHGGGNAMIGMAVGQIFAAFAQAQRQQAMIAEREARLQHMQQAIAQNRAQTDFLAHRKYPVKNSGIEAHLGDQAVIWYPSLEYQGQGPAYVSISTGADGFFVEVSGERYLAIYEMLQSNDPAQIKQVLTELLETAKRGHLIF